MLKEQGTVMEIDGSVAWVETQTQSGCSQCSSQGCTTSIVAKIFGAKTNRLAIENTLDASPGDQVVIGIPDDLLVKASLLAYLLPLIVMVVFTAIANAKGMSDGAQVWMALLGLASGFYLLQRMTRGSSAASRFKPRLLQVSHSDHAVIAPLGIHRPIPIQRTKS